MALFNKLDMCKTASKMLLLSLLFGLAACAPKRSQNGGSENEAPSPRGGVIVDGTESSGGGEPVYPTEAEVLEILQPYEGQYLDTPPFGKTPIITKARHVVLMFKNVRKIIINKPEALILDEIVANEVTLGLFPGMSEDNYIPKLVIEKNGPCYDKFDNNKPKTMAVSEFSVDASICVSVPMLKKIPKAKLLFESAALLLHEIAHQLGKNEEQAAAVQKYIVYELDWLMRGRFGLSEMIQESNKSITSYVDRLQEIDLLSKKPNFTNEDRIRIATLVAQQVANGDQIFELAARMNWETYYSRGSAIKFIAEKKCDDPFAYTKFCGEEPFVALGKVFKSLEDKLTTVSPQEISESVIGARLNLAEIKKAVGPYWPENVDLNTLATDLDPSAVRMTCEVNLYDINADVDSAEPLKAQEFVLTSRWRSEYFSHVDFYNNLKMELQMTWKSKYQSTEDSRSIFDFTLYDRDQTVLEYKYEPELGIKKDKVSKTDKTLDGKYLYKITCDYKGED